MSKTSVAADESNGTENKWLWRVLTVVFGLATVTSLGLAIYSIYRSEQLAKKEEDLNEELQRERKNLSDLTSKLKTLVRNYEEIEHQDEERWNILSKSVQRIEGYFKQRNEEATPSIGEITAPVVR